MANRTLYQRLLGADFDRLPPVLRCFHSLSNGSQAAGTVTVRGGVGPLRRSAARLLHMPRPGVDVPVRLQVMPQGQREVWIRHFGSQRLETVQWQENGFLIEQAGPLCFVFRVRAAETGLTFTFQHNRVGGIRLPAYASLHVAATATVGGTGVGAGTSGADQWHIAVKMQAPLVGTITTYAGEIRPQ